MLLYRHKLETTDHDLIKALGLISDAHDPAWPLPNMVEVQAEDFWEYRSKYAFASECYLGPYELHPNEWATVILYFCGRNGPRANGGFAVAIFSSLKSISYYEWSACRHEFVGTKSSIFHYRHECIKCHTVYEQFSDD